MPKFPLHGGDGDSNNVSVDSHNGPFLVGIPCSFFRSPSSRQGGNNSFCNSVRNELRINSSVLAAITVTAPNVMMGFEKRECRAMVAAAIRVRSTTSTLPAKLIHNEALEGGKEGRKDQNQSCSNLF